MKNKIKHILITWAKRLITWLYDKPNVVVDARPIYQDIHLNSTQAITNWLAMIDRPITCTHSDTTHTKGGGASDEESE